MELSEILDDSSKADTHIVSEIARRLRKEQKENGKTSFTIEDIKRIKNDIFTSKGDKEISNGNE